MLSTIQRSNCNLVKNFFYVFQETLEEDQTIVIDLTEERFNMTRGPTAVAGKGGAAAASAASSSSSNFKPSVTQWGGVTGGGPIPAPRQFAPSAHHHHHYQGNDLVEPLGRWPHVFQQRWRHFFSRGAP